jgi:glutathione S-transferase
MSATVPPRLYYVPRTRSSGVLWLLEEIGAPYALTEVRGSERQSAEHRARHPLGRVPVLELGEGSMSSESAAICLQLADLYPDAGLTAPVGSPPRALIYQWVLFAMSELEAPLLRWLRDLREGVTDSAERERFVPAAAAVDRSLGQTNWLVDGRFTVADVICASVLQTAQTRELLSQWPALGAYLRRALARPAYARAARIWDRPRS